MLKRACNCTVTDRKVTDHPLANEGCRLHFDPRQLLSADISWQAEDMDLLNTWHSAVLYEFRMLPVVWQSGKQPSHNHLSRSGHEAAEMDGIQKRRHSFPQRKPHPSSVSYLLLVTCLRHCHMVIEED